MVKNEKGSTLLLVLLISVILSALLLVLAASILGGAKRTETREEDVAGNLHALAAIKEGTAVTEAYIRNNSTALLNAADYPGLLRTDFIDKENAKNKGYHITDISDDKGIDSGYTRAIRIESDPYSQVVYVSAMPSFLKYALGSRSELTINGSASIKGNIYSNEALNVSDEALYTYKGKNNFIKTKLPVSKKLNGALSEVTVESGKINLCQNAGSSESNSYCYKTGTFDKNPTTWMPLEPSNLQSAFSSGSPVYTQSDSAFTEVDIPNTFYEKLLAAGVPISYNPSLNNSDDEKIEAIKNALASVPANSDDLNHTDENLPYVLYRSGSPEIDLDNWDSDKWLIIDGDANIESASNKMLNIRGNILVTGKLTLSGNLTFDSVIYVLGNTQIRYAKIDCYNKDCDKPSYSDDDPNNPAFILMTQKGLEVNIINTFGSKTKEDKGINGYLYTAAEANVFAVGSSLNVTGGLFSKNDLTVNSFRGSADSGSDDLILTADTDIDASRMKIVNNKKLFVKQEDALPKVKQLGVILDRLEKE